MSLIVKIILLGLLAFVLSLLVVVKIQYFFHLSFNSTLQLINGISGDLKKLPKCFNGAAIVAFFRIPLLWFGEGVQLFFQII